MNKIPISPEAMQKLFDLLKPPAPRPDASQTEMAWNECKRDLLRKVEQCFTI